MNEIKIREVCWKTIISEKGTEVPLLYNEYSGT